MLAGFAHWDPCAWAGGLVGGPVLAIAYWQYTATFQASEPSAYNLRYIFPLIAAVVFLAAAGATLEPIFDGTPLTYDYFTFLVLPIVGVGILFGWVGFLNLRWHRQLTTGPIPATLAEDGQLTPNPRSRFGKNIRQPLELLAGVAIAAAGVVCGLRNIPPQVAMHVSPEEAHLSLPPGATDVCVRRGFRGTISYNFAIDEAGFWEWAKSAGGSLESAASGVTILPVTGSFDMYDSFAPDGFHTITRGWYYDFHKEDRGHQYAYDADQGRAYFKFHAY